MVTMLSGIKTGKKKKKSSKAASIAKTPTATATATTKTAAASIQAVSQNVSNTAEERDSTREGENYSVAEKLRRSLASGDTVEKGTVLKTMATQNETKGKCKSDKHLAKASGDAELENPHLIVVDPMGATIRRTGQRDEEMSIKELVAEERQGNKMSWDEQMTRNLARAGKRKSRGDTFNGDSDEEFGRMESLLLGSDTSKRRKDPADRAQSREIHRQMHQHQQQEKITAMCNWWVGSSSFREYRLLACGNSVSLVMPLPNASLEFGSHFYLVPLKHATSFVDCDDDSLWEEVEKFRQSLENMFAKEKRAIVMFETVLPTKTFWQTKLEVVAVPFHVQQDCPIFFKSAMLEQTETWGTHQSLMSTTAEKTIKRTVPKGFPYFYINWGNVSTTKNTGYAQIIESSDFRHDFALDTLAGMMEVDPIRFKRRRKIPPHEEKGSCADFLTKWEKFDWTAR